MDAPSMTLSFIVEEGQTPSHPGHDQGTSQKPAPSLRHQSSEPPASNKVQSPDLGGSRAKA